MKKDKDQVGELAGSVFIVQNETFRTKVSLSTHRLKTLLYKK